MIDLVIGIVIGSAFAPFWMMVWGQMKDWYNAKNPPKTPPK